MKSRLIISLLLVLNSTFGICQLNINKFSAKINLEIPDKSVWTLVADNVPENGMKGVLMFKHKPITDSKGRPVEPVIVIVYEKVDEKVDAIVYSINALGQKPFHLNRELLGGYPEFSSDKHSVVFKGIYERENVKHRIMLGYIVFENIGIEIIGDSTDELYSQVENDIKSFLKSVNIKE